MIDAKSGLFWSTIAVMGTMAALQAGLFLVIGIIEDDNSWTFRFRIACVEHWWWTIQSILLTIAFILMVFSIMAGNDGETIGLITLFLGVATIIVQFTIPAWRARCFLENRWLAWTGPSRTTIDWKYRNKLHDSNIDESANVKARWHELDAAVKVENDGPASDKWGPSWPTLSKQKLIRHDATAILKGLKAEKLDPLVGNQSYAVSPCIYQDGQDNGRSMSLLWGGDGVFRPRVSRAIASVSADLLKSKPTTSLRHNGTGLILAMGILGRTKGLVPKALVFKIDIDAHQNSTGTDVIGLTSKDLEDTSVWAPRPSKVQRSHYLHELKQQYRELGPAFVAVAAELAVLLLDIPSEVLNTWLKLHLEHQDLELNRQMSARPRNNQLNQHIATNAELFTLYRVQYVAMILSLNFCRFDSETMDTTSPPAYRPELHCFVLLSLSEGSISMADWSTEQASGKTSSNWRKGQKPAWWDEDWVKPRLVREAAALERQDTSWRTCAALLLGLAEWPNGLEHGHWPELA